MDIGVEQQFLTLARVGNFTILMKQVKCTILEIQYSSKIPEFGLDVKLEWRNLETTDVVGTNIILMIAYAYFTAKNIILGFYSLYVQ